MERLARMLQAQGMGLSGGGPGGVSYLFNFYLG